MDALLGQVIVILILVVVILAITKVGGFLGGKPGASTQKYPEDLGKTMAIPEWKIQLLDIDTGEVIQEEVIPGLEKGQRFTIGREEDNDFIVDNPHVSRHHAKVICEKDTYRILEDKTNTGIVYKGNKVKDQAITERMTVYLAGVFPCRFVRTDAEDFLGVNVVTNEDEDEKAGFKTLEL